MTIVHIDGNNSQSFPQMIAGDEKVLVDFFANWCGPCKMQSPVLEELDAELGGELMIIKVDVDAAADLAEAYGVQSIPTLCLMKAGQVLKQESGFHSKPALLEFIQE